MGQNPALIFQRLVSKATISYCMFHISQSKNCTLEVQLQGAEPEVLWERLAVRDIAPTAYGTQLFLS